MPTRLQRSTGCCRLCSWFKFSPIDPNARKAALTRYISAILWTFRDNPAARAFYEANVWKLDRHGDFDLHGPRPISTPAARYVRSLNAAP